MRNRNAGRSCAAKALIGRTGNDLMPAWARFLAESDRQGARRLAVINEKLIGTLHLPENRAG
ncbi:hypothetical protein [Massilia sp. ST3]|uniref:hypothetical protein n=1 Tax=Massilia sp. ST3 TaxID=2824903 RepID=UPI001B8387DD|nr:hypothetical protein [Massilia sp. ST3]MBQ5949405.1 hypothetical protein [Massilia sp. ST3]